MEKTINSKLKLYFKDEAAAQRTISIDQVRPSYTDTEIKNAMDQMIQANVLKTSKGPVTKISKAEMEKIEKNPYKVKQA